MFKRVLKKNVNNVHLITIKVLLMVFLTLYICYLNKLDSWLIVKNYNVSMTIYKTNELNSIEFELRDNKAAIVDTDTVFGIVSLDKKNIYKIKKRPHYKKLVVFIKDFKDLNLFSANEIEVLKKYWPGKLTVIKNKIGYRVPNNKFLLNLLDRVSYLYSSSANISGQDPITDIDQAQKIFAKWANKLIIVDNKVNHDPFDKPSTIINLDTNRVVRNGNINGKVVLEELIKNE